MQSFQGDVSSPKTNSAPARLKPTFFVFPPARQQFASAFLQQTPRLPVAFVAVASPFLRRRQRAQHGDGFSALAEEQHRREQVPGVFGDHVGGEQVDLIERVVVLALVIGRELTTVSRPAPLARGLDLHAEIVAFVLDADVVGQYVSPRLADGEAALRGRGHELQLDPFSALLEAGESFPIFHVPLTSLLLVSRSRTRPVLSSSFLLRNFAPPDSPFDCAHGGLDELSQRLPHSNQEKS